MFKKILDLKVELLNLKMDFREMYNRLIRNVFYGVQILI